MNKTIALLFVSLFLVSGVASASFSWDTFWNNFWYGNTLQSIGVGPPDASGSCAQYNCKPQTGYSGWYEILCAKPLPSSTGCNCDGAQYSSQAACCTAQGISSGTYCGGSCTPTNGDRYCSGTRLYVWNVVSCAYDSADCASSGLACTNGYCVASTTTHCSSDYTQVLNSNNGLVENCKTSKKSCYASGSTASCVNGLLIPSISGSICCKNSVLFAAIVPPGITGYIIRQVGDCDLLHEVQVNPQECCVHGATEFTVDAGTTNFCNVQPAPFCNNNGVCDGTEDYISCPEDCHCGHFGCQAGETASNCPADCTPTTSCDKDGTCDAGESYISCPEDCHCGHFGCQAGETASNCPADCKTTYNCCHSVSNNENSGYIVRSASCTAVLETTKDKSICCEIDAATDNLKVNIGNGDLGTQAKISFMNDWCGGSNETPTPLSCFNDFQDTDEEGKDCGGVCEVDCSLVQSDLCGHGLGNLEHGIKCLKSESCKVITESTATSWSSQLEGGGILQVSAWAAGALMDIFGFSRISDMATNYNWCYDKITEAPALYCDNEFPCPTKRYDSAQKKYVDAVFDCQPETHRCGEVSMVEQFLRYIDNLHKMGRTATFIILGVGFFLIILLFSKMMGR